MSSCLDFLLLTLHTEPILPNRFGGSANGFHDVEISRTPAEVASDGVLYLVLVRTVIVFEEFRNRHQKARRTKAAL